MANVINVHNILFPKVFFAITIITSSSCDGSILWKYARMDYCAEVLKITLEDQSPLCLAMDGSRPEGKGIKK